MERTSILSAVLIAFVSLVVTTTASAGPGNNNIPENLAAYLNLSRQQNADSNQILANFYEFSGNWFNRYRELDRQVWDMRNDQTQDPGTIGIRVGNMITEQIRIEREVNQAASKANRTLIGLLNPVQTTLLSRLVDALNLAPTAWSAVSANFLSPPQPQERGGGGPVPAPPSVGMASERTGNTAFGLFYQAYRQQHPVAVDTPTE